MSAHLAMTHVLVWRGGTLSNESTVSEVRWRHTPGGVAATTTGTGSFHRGPGPALWEPEGPCYSLWGQERRVRGILRTYSFPDELVRSRGVHLWDPLLGGGQGGLEEVGWSVAFSRRQGT